MVSLFLVEWCLLRRIPDIVIAINSTCSIDNLMSAEDDPGVEICCTDWIGVITLVV